MLGKLAPRLETRILLGYSIACIIVLVIAFYLTYLAYNPRWGLDEAIDVFNTWFALVITLFVGGLAFRRFGRSLDTVHVLDRRIALIQCAWVYGPFMAAWAVLFCRLILDDIDLPFELPGLGPTVLEEVIRWLALLASITWVLVSAPIARLWATNNAEDPEALLLAEEGLFLNKTQRDVEAHISIPTYYTFVLSIFAMLFLIFESIIGELFERLTRVSGFVGSVVAALCVAAVLYPINRRVSAVVARMREVSQESGRADLLYALRSAITSTSRYLRAEKESEAGQGLHAIAIVTLIIAIMWFGFASWAP